MTQAIAHVSLVVRDYDEAIAFFTTVLDFTLVEDTCIAEQGKRWVLVAPRGPTGTSLVLARPSKPGQEAFVGDQTGGRVTFFLRTDDFWRDYTALRSRGVGFARPPANAPYGMVAVFKDLYGNLWDLIGPAGAQGVTNTGEQPTGVTSERCQLSAASGFGRFGGADEASREAYASAKTAFIDAIHVSAFYNGPYDEAARVAAGTAQLEFERTKEILARHLPPPPARVLDVGGAAGAYSLWLASLGYEVHLVDTAARLVDEARRRSAVAVWPIASMRVGNACALEEARESADVVLMLGPLYHLTAAGDRATALSEAHRVLRFGGVVAAAGISRYASTLDGLAQNLALDPQFVAIRDQDLRDGQHRNPTNHPAYFTTAYFHTPDGLREELADSGFDEPRVLGVEGPAWILPDFDMRWAAPAQRDLILDAARLLEAHPSVIGASAHLLGLAWKR